MNTLNSIELVEQLINNNEIVLIYYGSKTCGVCNDMKPKIEAMLNDYPKIKSAYVDVEKSHNIAIHYSFFTIPAINLFINGKESIREARHISMKDINSRVERYYSLLFE